MKVGNSMKYIDYFGISYFVAITTTIFMSTFYSIPYVYQENTSALRYRQLLVFMLVEVLLNVFLVLKNRSVFVAAETLQTKQVNPQTTSQTCPTCVHFMPQRTHHCPLCNKCILKRDHHCFFIGACIGFRNQRYFLVFSFYCALASMFGMYVNLYYLSIAYSHTVTSWWNFCPPVAIIYWLYGYVDGNLMAQVLMTYTIVVTAVGLVGIFVWQSTLVLYGCTSYELFKAGGKLNKCSVTRISSVFGPLWWVNFIVPLPCLKQTGNGIDWGDPKHL